MMIMMMIDDDDDDDDDHDDDDHDHDHDHDDDHDVKKMETMQIKLDSWMERLIIWHFTWKYGKQFDVLFGWINE